MTLHLLPALPHVPLKWLRISRRCSRSKLTRCSFCFAPQGARAGTADDLPSNRPAAFQGTGRTLTGATTQAPQAPGRAVITFYR